MRLTGLAKLLGVAVVKSFEDIAPELGRYILEFSYGDVFSKPKSGSQNPRTGNGFGIDGIRHNGFRTAAQRSR